jgi:DNA gyrase/topoisomerase IV subunit A
MYKLNVNKIDLCNINSTGMNLFEIINEKIVGIYAENEKIPYLIFITKNGLIKKIKTNSVVKLSKIVGAPVMKVLEDDEIIECMLATDEDSIILNNGKKDKEIKVKDLVDKGRGAGGVVGVKPLKNCVCTIVKK